MRVASLNFGEEITAELRAPAADYSLKQADHAVRV